MMSIRVSDRVRAWFRLTAVALVALAVGIGGGVVLWQGMQSKQLVPVLIGLTVISTEYIGIRVALASVLHPAAVFVRRLKARRAMTGEAIETKNALVEAARIARAERAPVLYVMDSPAVNAFMSGNGYERAAGVTTGFTNSLDHDSQVAVFVALLARDEDESSLIEGISWALGSTRCTVPQAGVRPDYARAMARYREGDERALKLLGLRSTSLAEALRVGYATPGRVVSATPANADAFFIWPCGQTLSEQEQQLEGARLRVVVDAVEAMGGHA